MEKKAYTGIDYFRMIAALLVVTIHTSPLLTYSETGDFILTRIIARVAVPFFFMTSGFFLISEYQKHSEKIKVFVKKTLIIYGIAIIIYIPINIYNHYFSMDHFLVNIIKDIVFDGTMYHLWYLPAAIMGAVISWYLVKKIGMRDAFMIAVILYIVGMFGDSYYGVIENIPVLRGMYGYIFQVSDYTRNGIFFAPVFFILGGMIADESEGISFGKSIVGFVGALILMICEGMLLHKCEVQRHDSMYIMLLPCMFFFFHILIHTRGKRNDFLSPLALVIYIIHPLIIVVVRIIAKFINMEAVFVENSMVHYCTVAIISVTVSALIILIYTRWKPMDKKGEPHNTARAWIEIDENHLKHNVHTLQNAMQKDCELMAVVKADAYGHGAVRISTLLNQMGVKAFAVATIEEGIELRCHGIKGEILILGYTDPQQAKEVHKYHLMQSLVDYDYAVELAKQGYRIKAHISINTGMNRLGFNVDNITEIEKTFQMEQLDICGIYTHLCVADSRLPQDIEFTKKQISSFYRMLEEVAKKGIKIPKVHIQSSYGLLNYPELKCDYVRVGVALYGVLSSPKDETKLKMDLRPVLSLKTKVILIREVKKNETVGYGRTFVANRDSNIAILSIGYADGVPRNLASGQVLINGYQVPVIGRICMDQLAVDVTEIPEIAVGDIATVIGSQGDKEMSAPEVADHGGSISNELLSRMGTRVKIVS